MPVQTQLQQRRGTAASWTSTNPTLAAGEIGFESDTGKIKIGNGSTAWNALAYTASSTAVTYLYNATAAQTTFSGADANGLTLAYTVGAEQVYLNGALQVRGSDYTATNGTSIVLASGALVNDVLNVIAYSAMSVADTYTQAQANALFIPDAIVDAKGDLIAATASDTVARLAVGSNGDTLVADSSTSTGLRYTAGTVQSNPVLNSAMQVWQRGTSVAQATNGYSYTADRWSLFAQGLNNACTASRQVTNDTTNLPFIQYCARVQRNSGQTGTSGVGFSQFMESINSIPFAGKTVTFSFYARAGANFSAASNLLTVYLIGGTGTDQNQYAGYTGQTTPVNSTATLTTTWQRFTYTATVGSTVTELATSFFYTPTGTAGAADFYEITGVQLDVGSIALPFRTYAGTIQGELAACQRYYFRATANNLYVSFGAGANYSTTGSQIHLTHPVAIRTASSIDFSTLALLNSTGGVVTFTGITYTGAGPLGSFLNITGASGLVAGYANILISNNSTAGYIAINGEL
jgi:hypothetical protein